MQFDPAAPEQSQEDNQPPSKSALKRQMLALQDMGKQLLQLNTKQLESLNLDTEMHAALDEYQRIKSHEAKRRHLQRIGKLLRQRDHDSIKSALEIFDSSSAAHNRHFQQLEYWRDRLIAEDNALEEFINLWPNCEIQLLRQLIRNARQELAAAKPPANSRKLFRYLRELAE